MPIVNICCLILSHFLPFPEVFSEFVWIVVERFENFTLDLTDFFDYLVFGVGSCADPTIFIVHGTSKICTLLLYMSVNYDIMVY